MKTFVGFFNGHSHAWMTLRASNSTRNKQIISAHIFLWATDRTILNSTKLITYYLIIRFKTFKPCSVRSPKTKLRAEIICLRVNLLAPGVIHACQWNDWRPPKLRFWPDCFYAEGRVWLRTAVMHKLLYMSLSFYLIVFDWVPFPNIWLTMPGKLELYWILFSIGKIKP